MGATDTSKLKQFHHHRFTCYSAAATLEQQTWQIALAAFFIFVWHDAHDCRAILRADS